jgi:hypothetical protein
MAPGVSTSTPPRQIVVRFMVHPSSIIPGSEVASAYLGLASARGLPVATTDERLGAACRAAGVDLVG